MTPAQPLRRRMPAMLGPLFVMLAAPAVRAQQNPEKARPTAFVHVSVIPMDRERVLADQTVVVRGGNIVALGSAKKVRVPLDAVQVDGRGKFLVPGFGDMHTHFANLGTAHVERELLLILASGVTTVRNMDYMPNSWSNRIGFATAKDLDGPALLRLRARVASGELLGPRIYTSASWRTDTTKSVDANLASYKAAGYDHLKWYREDSVTTDSIAAAVRRLRITLVGHGLDPDSGGITRTLALGFKSAEHLVPYSNDSRLAVQVAATVRAGLWNCLSPVMWRPVSGGSPLERRYLAAEYRILYGEPASAHLAALTAPPTAAPLRRPDQLTDVDIIIKALHDSGAKLLLGTDQTTRHMGLHRGMQLVVQIGFTPYEALALATRNVAEYFGTLDSVGTVAVGKRADLVLLTGNPLEDIRHVSDIAGVMAVGRWLTQAELDRRLDAYYQDALQGH